MINIISNNYGVGEDDLFIYNRRRIHTDDSIEVKYYDKPDVPLDKMAFSLTGDLGCEYGGGVSCYGDKSGGPKQSFIGFMAYNRLWFHHDLFGLTLGGGKINNPGRYLVLLPPINGETAVTAATNSPYFTENPGNPFKAWDSSVTFDYMPKQYITFRWEYDYRHANVPYWTGQRRHHSARRKQRLARKILPAAMAHRRGKPVSPARKRPVAARTTSGSRICAATSPSSTCPFW